MPRAELDRLIKQAAFFGDLTAHTLKLAGLGPGMRVLDLGCGAGDVSLLAASIVGPSGSVTGVDMSADTVKATQAPHRQARRSSNVTIEAGDITKLPYAGEFDAVIGRLIVLYLGDPVAGMKAFRGYVKPGGLDLLPGIRPAADDLDAAGAVVRPGPRMDRGGVRARQDRTLHGDAAGRTVSRTPDCRRRRCWRMSRIETGPDSTSL